MAALEKAKLQEVTADENETTVGQPVSVQFNPTSLKLKITNQNSSSRSRSSQRSQHVGAGSTVLSTELVFDTADEGTEAAPVSVRTKTAIVEKYLFPKKGGSDTPPRVRFEWNDLVVSGIIENLDIDFDLFASNGTPLRAKMSISIKEQEAKYQFLKAGAGRRNSNGAQDGNDSSSNGPGGGTNDPNGGRGGGSGSDSDRSSTALEGESPAEFAARQGLDPSAWRGLDVDLNAGLSLEAGIEVGFNASLSFNAGIGVTAGIQAGLDLSLEAAVGLDASFSAGAKVSAGMSADAAAGFALSAAGGVNSAIETVKISKSEAAAQQTKQAFGMSAQSTQGATTTASASSSTVTTNATAVATLSSAESANSAGAAQAVKRQQQQKHTPLTVSGSLSPSQQQAAKPSPPPPKADQRSVSYGQGVPLRPLYKTVVQQQQVVVCGHGIKSRRLGSDGPPIRKDPTTAPWVELPAYDRARTKADQAEKEKRRQPCSVVHASCCKGGNG